MDCGFYEHLIYLLLLFLFFLDSPGIKLFGFHGKINDNTGPKDTGTINGDVLQAKNGRWVFEDLNVRLVPGDKINYWVFVQQDIYGYRKDKQSYTVERKFFTVSSLRHNY